MMAHHFSLAACLQPVHAGSFVALVQPRLFVMESAEHRVWSHGVKSRASLGAAQNVLGVGNEAD